MAASGVNILRYSALFGGIAYGFMHQRTISTQQEQTAAQQKYEKEQALIEKAKAEWTRKSMPQDKKTAGGNIISDPNDPKFDLEAFLTMKMADEASHKP